VGEGETLRERAGWDSRDALIFQSTGVETYKTRIKRVKDAGKIMFAKL